jgi:hypothetical protein
MTQMNQAQYTEGEGKEPQHLHPPTKHVHDHYHVSHHHGGKLTGEWDHRTYWHTHEHNHSEMSHSHDYSRADEEKDHDRESHIHDHASPAQSTANMT